MAVTVKSSSTLNVTLTSETSSLTTFKLNNPKSTVTRAQVDTAFAELLGYGIVYVGLPPLLCNSVGDKFTGVDNVQVVETTVRTEDLV